MRDLHAIVDIPIRLMHINRFSRSVRLFLLGSFLLGVGQNFWSLFFNLMMQAAGWSKHDIGGTLAFQQLATVALSIPAAYLLARYRTRQVLIPTVGVGIAILIASVWTDHVLWMRALLFLGFGGMVTHRVLSGVFFTTNTPRAERDYAFSAWFTMGTLGSILGNLIAGFLKDTVLDDPTLALDPTTAYRWTITLGLAIAGLSLWPFALIDDPRPPKGPLKVSWRRVREIDWWFFVKALLPNFLIGIGAGLVIQFMNLYFRDRFNTTDASMGGYMATMSAAMMIAFMLSPLLAERWGRVPTIVASQLASLPFMIILGYTGSLPMAVTAFVARGVLMNMAGPIGSSLIMDHCPEVHRTLLNALGAMSLALSWAVSAALFGGALRGDYRVTFAIASVLYFSAAILYYVFFARLEGAREPKRATSTRS